MLWALCRFSFYSSGHSLLYFVDSYFFINPLKSKHSVRLFIIIPYNILPGQSPLCSCFQVQFVLPIQTYMLIRSMPFVFFSSPLECPTGPQHSITDFATTPPLNLLLLLLSSCPSMQSSRSIKSVQSIKPTLLLFTPKDSSST